MRSRRSAIGGVQHGTRRDALAAARARAKPREESLHFLIDGRVVALCEIVIVVVIVIVKWTFIEPRVESSRLPPRRNPPRSRLRDMFFSP